MTSKSISLSELPVVRCKRSKKYDPVGINSQKARNNVVKVGVGHVHIYLFFFSVPSPRIPAQIAQSMTLK